MDTLQEANQFQFVSPTIKFTDKPVNSIQAYGYIPTNLKNDKKTLNYFVSWSNSIYVVNMTYLDQENMFSKGNGEVKEQFTTEFMLKFVTSPQDQFN